MKEEFSNNRRFVPIKTKEVEVFAISTVMNGSKMFVSSLDQRKGFDNKLLPSYNSDKEEAKDFESHSDAQKSIARIVNHLDRVFTIEKATVKRPFIDV